jgi:hypothetical protein
MMPSTRCHRLRPGWALALAVAATSTALCMSVLAGWQRGGWLTERLVWVAIGVVLVVGAHLLPALCRSAPLAVRAVGVVLWLGCMVGASYGHATFVLLSQSHAGELRVAAVPASSVPAHRSLTVVMADLATVTADLAAANARRCVRDCPALRVRRVSLAARRAALDAEADDVRRQQAIDDRNATRREALRDDPVTTRLAVLFAMPSGHVDLFAGLAFASMLEGVACLLWSIALLPHQVTVVTAAIEVVTASPPDPASPDPAVAEPETEVTKLARDIKAGLVRPTVSDIRRHLRCSQEKAAALRRQILASSR